MFDFEKEREAARIAAEKPTEYAKMSVSQLLELRAQIDKHLPALELKDINLEQELIKQFLLTRELQTQVLTDINVPANQRAQVANACAAILGDLQNTQTKLYSAERFKKIEALLIKTLQQWPKEQTEEFLRSYEALMGAKNA